MSFSWIAALNLSRKLWNSREFHEKCFMFKVGRFTEAFKFVVKLEKLSLWFPRDEDCLSFENFLKTESISKIISKICKEKSLERSISLSTASLSSVAKIFTSSSFKTSDFSLSDALIPSNLNLSVPSKFQIMDLAFLIVLVT